MFFVLLLSTTALTAAPVPKDVEKQNAEKFRKLRESYDQKLKELGGSREGQRLRVLMATAKLMAERILAVEEIKDTAERERRLPREVELARSMLESAPEVRELYELYCYELRTKAKKP